MEKVCTSGSSGAGWFRSIKYNSLVYVPRYFSNEDIIDLALQTLGRWCQENKNLPVLARKGFIRILVNLLRSPSGPRFYKKVGYSFMDVQGYHGFLNVSHKLMLYTALSHTQGLLTTIQCLRRFVKANQGIKPLGEAGIWDICFSYIENPKVPLSLMRSLWPEVFDLVATVIEGYRKPATLPINFTVSHMSLSPLPDLGTRKL